MIGMSDSRASQLVDTMMSPTSSGRSRRMRSIFSHTSVRATFMFCDQSNSSPMVPPLSSMCDHMFFMPLTEPTASSTGRTTRRSICAGDALGYGNRTNSMGFSKSGMNASGRRNTATSPSTTRLTMSMSIVTWRLMAISGRVMATPAYGVATAGATDASTVTRDGTHT
jgi:hypothetical protein